MKTYYKAFNKDMTCRGKQYAENTVFEEPRAEMCQAGMHFCENPFDVLDYYPLIASDGSLITTAEVEPQAEVKTKGYKSVTTKLKIRAKLSLREFIEAGIDFLLEHTRNNAVTDDDGYGAKISASCNYAQISSSGDHAYISSSGDGAKIGSSGDYAQICSSCDYVQIVSLGDKAKVSSSGDEAKIVSLGVKAKVSSSGDHAQIASEGANSVVCCVGDDCSARAKRGSWITLAEWDIVGGEYKPMCVKTEYVDGERIKSDTWYHLEGGEFVEGII